MAYMAVVRLEHLARVARVIKSPGGNALLVGLGGSGRQSCTRLAPGKSYRGEIKNQSYNGHEWTTDSRKIKEMS